MSEQTENKKGMFQYIKKECGYVNAIATLVLLYFLFRFSSKWGEPMYEISASSIATALYSVLTINLFVFFINALTGGIKRVQAIANIVFLIFTCLYFSYHFKVNVILDYSVFAENTDILFTVDSFNEIRNALHISHIIALACIVSLSILLHLRFNVLYNSRIQKKFILRSVLFGALYAAVLFLPIQTYDDFTNYIKTVTEYYHVTSSKKEISGYPYYNDTIRGSAISRTTMQKTGDYPDIFLIMIESFNSYYIEKKSPDGKEYTPFINSLIKDGVYVEKFYANSIQTAKGQSSVFLSVLPSYKKKIFRMPTLNVTGLPEILRDNGYSTVFLQAYDDIVFENTYQTMKKFGFSHVASVKKYITAIDKEKTWGWGIEDSVLYNHFFDYYEKELKDGKHPLFVTLATISAHSPDKIPANERFIYTQPKTRFEHCANAFYLSDMQLKDFFSALSKRSEFNNALFIITGDHSTAIGLKGNTLRESGIRNEQMQTPLVLYWKGKLAHKRINNRIFSQVDIAPTILDMLGIKNVKNHFVGTSVFNTGITNIPVYMVQPYDGRTLSALTGKYKYIIRTSTGEETVYDLSKDPDETTNIVQSIHPGILSDLRKSIDPIHLNQAILESNALKPAKN
jgi:arylsulfatase A-like enzyme